MSPYLGASEVRVTIGMCVKNSEATIKEAVESVLTQDYPSQSMELLVVDGRSRDNTLKILENSLRGAKIGVRMFSESEGLGRARQIVVDNASGEYIVWVDGDMTLDKGFVKKQVEFMDHHPDAGIAKGKYGVRINGKRETVVATLENVEFLLATASEGRTDSKALGASGCVYRVKALKQVGGFDTGIKGVGEDMDIEDRIRRKGWQLHVSSAIFFETRRQTWKALWSEYFWHGSGGRYMFEKNKRAINIEKMFPPWAILAELLRVPAAYRLTHRKVVLFLPFHYAFKRVAWFLGFLESARANLKLTRRNRFSNKLTRNLLKEKAKSTSCPRRIVEARV